MSRPMFVRCLMVAGLLAFATSSMWAQTGSKSPTTQNAAEKTFRGRLPNNYARVGVDPKQREKIYGIQAKYHVEIQELEQRLAELKLKQSEEIYAVLTPEQKASLKALQDKSTTGSKSTAATKPDADE